VSKAIVLNTFLIVKPTQDAKLLSNVLRNVKPTKTHALNHVEVHQDVIKNATMLHQNVLEHAEI